MKIIIYIKNIKEKLIVNNIWSRFAVTIIIVCLILVVIREVFLISVKDQTQPITELYFENHLSLPSKIKILQENYFEFTIHNLEHSDVEYIYQVYLDEGNVKKIIDDNVILIKKNEYKSITEKIIFNRFIEGRVKVVVNLINKNQQIHFWMGEENIK